MSSAACKVILCGSDHAAANEQIKKYAEAVLRGEISGDEVDKALYAAADALDRATAALRKATKAAMVAAFG